MENIETKRFELLKVEMTDAEAIFEILSNQNVITNLNTEIHKTIEDTKKMIEEYEMEYKENKKFPYKIVDRRPGDIAACYADPTKAYNELGWKAEYGVEDMMRDSYNYILKQNEK